MKDLERGGHIALREDGALVLVHELPMRW